MWIKPKEKLCLFLSVRILPELDSQIIGHYKTNWGRWYLSKQFTGIILMRNGKLSFANESYWFFSRYEIPQTSLIQPTTLMITNSISLEENLHNEYEFSVKFTFQIKRTQDSECSTGKKNQSRNFWLLFMYRKSFK